MRKQYIVKFCNVLSKFKKNAYFGIIRWNVLYIYPLGLLIIICSHNLFLWNSVFLFFQLLKNHTILNLSISPCTPVNFHIIEAMLLVIYQFKIVMPSWGIETCIIINFPYLLSSKNTFLLKTLIWSIDTAIAQESAFASARHLAALSV